jgi:hypothetical protein
MAIYKIKRFSKFSKSELEEIKEKMPPEYLSLQAMSQDLTLKSNLKKAKYLDTEKGEFPYFELISLDTLKKEDYQNNWILPLMYVDNLQTPIYYNFKKGVWENFQHREIKDLKSYLFDEWNTAYLEWEDGELDDILTKEESDQFGEYTRILVRSVRRYLF